MNKFTLLTLVVVVSPLSLQAQELAWVYSCSEIDACTGLEQLIPIPKPPCTEEICPIMWGDESLSSWYTAGGQTFSTYDHEVGAFRLHVQRAEGGDGSIVTETVWTNDDITAIGVVKFSPLTGYSGYTITHDGNGKQVTTDISSALN